MIEHFTFWGAFFLIEELFILIPLLICCIDYKDKDEVNISDIEVQRMNIYTAFIGCLIEIINPCCLY